MVGFARFASTKVSAENVKLLRQQTSLSIGLCRKALENGNNDIAGAMKWLQDNEQARAEYSTHTTRLHDRMAKSKLNARETAQGRIAILATGQRGVMVEARATARIEC